MFSSIFLNFFLLFHFRFIRCFFYFFRFRKVSLCFVVHVGIVGYSYPGDIVRIPCRRLRFVCICRSYVCCYLQFGVLLVSV